VQEEHAGGSGAAALGIGPSAWPAARVRGSYLVQWKWLLQSASPYIMLLFHSQKL
jgi:hypothetical protein